jgi:tetratricopeptide (TPR) repeat protein
MKIISLILIIFTICPVVLCLADDSLVKEAYSLYYRGEVEAAITMMEENVQENPHPGAYYFLGYVYYEMEDMETAREYFNEAFLLKSFYSPMTLQEEE